MKIKGVESIGQLNKKIMFQKPSRVSDGRGGWKITGFVDYKSAYANIVAQTGGGYREDVRAEQQQTTMTYQLTVRHRTDITADMRIVSGNQKLYITKLPHDPDGRRRWLAMEVEERLT